MYYLSVVLSRLMLAVLVAALAACSDLMPVVPDSGMAPIPAPVRRYRTADITVQVTVPSLTRARPAHYADRAAAVEMMAVAAADRSEARAVPLPLYAAIGSHADVKSVTVTAAGNDANGDRQDPLATVTLTKSEGTWTGTLAGITLGTPITFTAAAKNSSDTVLFRGTHTATLTRDTARVALNLAAVGDISGGQFPVVSGITVQKVRAGGTTTVTVSATGKKAETLNYQFSNGTFSPVSGSVTTDSPQSGTTGTASITSTYTAPSTKGGYTARLAVTNAAGNRVAVDFRISVEEPASLSATLGPVVLSVAGRRIPAGVQWTAAVSSAGDGSGVTYAWTFTGSSNVAVAGTSFADAAKNPALLTGYDQTKTGTLSVTATEGGLTSTASFTVPANLFPNALQLPKADLVINEINYDTPGDNDTKEFVEILNPGAGAVDLTGYLIELVDVSRGRVYASYTGTGSLGAGKYLVIGDSAVLDGPSFPAAAVKLALGSSGLQQGPDVIRIVKIATKEVMDAVQYEGTATGAGEGAPAPTDPATADKSIGRCPSGSDSNDNGADFRAMTATPGAANTCS